jgi:hypothetical protein
MSQKYFDKYVLKSNTAAGEAFVHKYLHPPGIKTAAFNGIPDANSMGSVHIEHRLVDEVPVPYKTIDVPQGVSEYQGNYIFLPQLLYPLISVNTQPKVPWAFDIVCPNTNWQANTISQNFNRVRMDYQSVTLEMDATGFNNTGTIYANQLPLSTEVVPSSYFILTKNLSNDDISAFEKEFDFYKGELVKIKQEFMKHYTMLEESSVFGADLHYCAKKFASKVEKFKALNYSNTEIIRLGKLSNSPSVITQGSVGFYQGAFSEGLYGPLQFTQASPRWKDIVNSDFDGTTSTANLMYKAFEFYDESNDPQLLLLKKGDKLVTDVPCSDASYLNFCIRNATLSQGAGVANTRLKVMLGYSFTPAQGSAFSSFISAPVTYDPVALDTISMVTSERNDAYPSKFNTLGLDQLVKSDSGLLDLTKEIVSSTKDEAINDDKLIKGRPVQEEKKSENAAAGNRHNKRVGGNPVFRGGRKPGNKNRIDLLGDAKKIETNQVNRIAKELAALKLQIGRPKTDDKIKAKLEKKTARKPKALKDNKAKEQK